MKKQILLLAMMLLPMVAGAYDAKIDGIYYNFDTNELTATVTYYSSDDSNKNAYTGKVNIPASFTYNGTEYSVTRIDSYAFRNCSSLTSVTIPNSVIIIGSGAFLNCSSLTSVTIPNSVTNIGHQAFSGTGWYNNQPDGLLYLDKWLIEYKGGKPTGKIVIEEGTRGIADFAFSYCIGLTSVTIPNSVTRIGQWAFSNCSSLTSVTIPNGVTSIRDCTFIECRSLTSVTIGNSVTSIGRSAFYGCSGLISVTIGNSVTSIDQSAFCDCNGLTSVTIPNSVTSIGQEAFSYCSNMTSVTIGNGVTSIGQSAFSGCSGLTSVHISDIASWCKITFKDNPLSYAHHLYLGEEEIKDLVIPNSVTSIGNNTFWNCSGLTSVTMGNSVTSIGYYAFRGCSGLTSVTIPNSVMSIGELAFDGCSGLTSVTIGSGVTSIGQSTFSGCSGLTSVTIPNSVTNIGDKAFYQCSGLTSVTIPNSVTSIGDMAFEGCSGLTSVTIPNSVTSIGRGAFECCGGLTSVTIGNSVTSIGDYAFNICSSLTSVTIPNSVKNIGYRAFSGCNEIRQIVIGDGIKGIGSESFANCQKINDVYCYTVRYPQTEKNAFENSYPDYITLHVPDGAVEQYRNVEPWSKFKSVVALKSSDPKPDDNYSTGDNKCATPSIWYSNGELSFSCATDGVEFITEITDADIKQHNTETINLTATYYIRVYAKKQGYDNSDIATATLVWTNATFTETTPWQSSVKSVTRDTPVLITNQGGTIIVTTEANGIPVAVYTIDGQLYGSSIVSNGQATISTTLQAGSIAIVKIGQKAVKVVVK